MEGGPPGFRQGFTCPAVLRYLTGSHTFFAYRAFTLYGQTFQSVQLNVRLVTPAEF